MRLLSSIQHRTCADGSYMKEYQLSDPLTEEFFQYLKSFGTVEQVSKLDDGYYTFSKPDWFSIKGLVGDTTVEVRFTPATMDITSDFLRMLFAKFTAEPDIAYLKQCEASRNEQIKSLKIR